ncbi:MAG: ATP-binding protein [Bacilli bacterium]|nr:ATP-binding protein [Bacilli bacterium]
MIIKSIYIKNFKAFEDKTIYFQKHNVIIGDNDSGKSTILEALDIFFNDKKINPDFVRNPDEEVVFGIFTDGKKFIKKVYKGKTYRLDEKLSMNIADIKGISYIYIPYNNDNPVEILENLASSIVEKKIIGDGTDKSITDAANDAINDILKSIDGKMLVVQNANSTTLLPNSTLDIKKAIKYNIDSSGVPLEGRGSGYQKNLVYALLTTGNYENVILGIDEIENSFSYKNVENLVAAIKEKIAQTLITTHSTQIMKITDINDVVPLFTDNVKSITDLYSYLGGVEKTKTFVLVEGKTDMKWIKKAIEIIGETNKYLVIQCGGHTNIEPVKSELIHNGFTCKTIKDGDSGDEEHSLSKECIELYIPLNTYRQMFDSDATIVPLTKADFFAKCHSLNIYKDIGADNDSPIKMDIAEMVSDFLNSENPLIKEVKNLLK